MKTIFCKPQAGLVIEANIIYAGSTTSSHARFLIIPKQFLIVPERFLTIPEILAWESELRSLYNTVLTVSWTLSAPITVDGGIGRKIS